MNRLADDTNAWEKLCRRCGLCCFEKLEEEDGTVYITDVPCRYLDVVTRQCRIYERRFTINPVCMQLTPELVADLHWLHDGCGYVRTLRRTDGNEDD